MNKCISMNNLTTRKDRWVGWVMIGIGLGFGLGLVGCRPGGGGGGGGHQMPPPPGVTVAAVEQRELLEWQELTGRTAPVEFVEIRPRVSGYVERVAFEAGQVVKKGDVLFVIDARWHRADLDRREAELTSATIRAENAEKEMRRNVQLLAGKALSREEAEAREARFQEAKAALLAAEASRNVTRLDLEHTEVRAPISGRVSRALVTAGNYVSGQAGGATLLTTLVSVDPIHVYVDMDENAFLRYQALSGAGKLPANAEGRVPAELQLADETAFPHHGYVESLDNRVDPQSGSIVLRALFANPGGRILPGLFARLRLPAGPKAPVLLVEETAIGTDQAQKFVLSLTSSNTAGYRPVTLGPLVGEKRVVRSGVEAGDKIIVNGIARIRPGMPVSPEEAKGASGKAPAPSQP